MREAAITAGLVQSARAGDRNWRDRLRIITYVALLRVDMDTDCLLETLVNRRPLLFIVPISQTFITLNQVKTL
jgi:hypothetical protein